MPTCIHYSTWSDQGDASIIKIFSNAYSDIIHASHPNCKYDATIKVRGRRHFRPGTYPPPPTGINDFWSEIKIDFEYRNGEPFDSSSSSGEDTCDDFDEDGTWTGRFPGVFLNPDWTNYANAYTIPNDINDFVEDFICGGIPMIPTSLPADCTGWETPFCT